MCKKYFYGGGEEVGTILNCNHTALPIQYKIYNSIAFSLSLPTFSFLSDIYSKTYNLMSYKKNFFYTLKYFPRIVLSILAHLSSPYP